MSKVSDSRGVFKQAVGSLEQTIEHVISTCGTNNVLICGSFFIMSDVRKTLQYPPGQQDECDEDFINKT